MRQWSFSAISARPRSWLVAGLVGATAATVFALAFTSKYTPDAHASVESAAVAAVPVTVGLLTSQSVKPFVEFSGRIDAVDFAEIRPQVSGRVTEIHFRDGQTATCLSSALCLLPTTPDVSHGRPALQKE